MTPLNADKRAIVSWRNTASFFLEVIQFTGFKLRKNRWILTARIALTR